MGRGVASVFEGRLGLGEGGATTAGLPAIEAWIDGP